MNIPTTPSNYEVGDVVSYEAFGGAARVVVVTHKVDDVKKGLPGFDGYLLMDPTYTVWGYDDQITNVLGRYREAVAEGLADRWGAIARYLPANYTSTVDGEDVRITGWDSHGWTLDGYVIPRLASGMYYAVEVTP